jgi:hypothetical protein
MKIITDSERGSPKIGSIQENECGRNGVRRENWSELAISKKEIKAIGKKCGRKVERKK